jgi:hypothetical protein
VSFGCVGLLERFDDLVVGEARYEEVEVPLQVKLHVFDLEHVGLAVLGQLARGVYYVLNKVVGDLQ